VWLQEVIFGIMVVCLSQEADEAISKRGVVSQETLDVWEREGQNSFTRFFFFGGGVETGFLCVALAILELTL
jgi:hypothetical protein